MGDRLTYCDVMESCEECPRYGKDCDGDKRDDDRLPSAEATCSTCADRAVCIMSDDVNWKACKDYRAETVHIEVYRDLYEKYVELKHASAEANSEDLIIKGAKGIQDGLYNIKDGKLFKYKANGGTVRTYEIVPSAEAVHGEWIDTGNWMGIECSRCKCHSRYVTPFCPQCGAKMKGGYSE